MEKMAMKNRFLKTLLTVITAVMMMIPVQTIKADSTSRYLVAVLYDYASYKLQYSIFEDEEPTPYRLQAYSGGDTG